MRQTLIKIALKLLLALVIGIGLNFVYKYFQWERDLDKLKGYHKEFGQIAKADIIYLGDCSDAYFEKADSAGIKISEELDHLLINQRVASISDNGLESKSYLKLVQQLPETSSGQKLILTLNLRSFSPRIRHETTYHDWIERKLVLQQSQLFPLWNRTKITFKAFESRTREEMDALKLDWWTKDTLLFLSDGPQTFWDWKENHAKELDHPETGKLYLRCMQDFAVNIDLNYDDIITDYQNMIVRAREKGYEPILHIIPINLEDIQTIAGSELSEFIYQNKQKVKLHFEGQNVTVIDYFESVPADDFLERGSSSHFTASGKSKIARYLEKSFREN